MNVLKTGLLFFMPAILLFSCSKDPIPVGEPNKTEKQFSATGFSEIQVADNFQINIRQGNSFFIKATGAIADLNDMEIVADINNQLHIGYKLTNRLHNEVVKVDIVMPHLRILYTDGEVKASIDGFKQQASFMRVELTETTEVTIGGAPDELTFLLYGKAKLIATGSTSGLYGTLYNSSSLEAYGLTSTSTEVEASGTATARLTGTQRLRLGAADASIIRYKGEPASIRTEISGTARIIKE